MVMTCMRTVTDLAYRCKLPWCNSKKTHLRCINTDWTKAKNQANYNKNKSRSADSVASCATVLLNGLLPVCINPSAPSAACALEMEGRHCLQAYL